MTSAKDMKTAIDSYGGFIGCHAVVVKIQESNQTMKKYKITGILALNDFTFESAGLRAWRAYNVGPGKLFTSTQVKRFGLPQGPTGLQVVQPFGIPGEDVGVFRSVSTDPVLRSNVQRHTSLLQICRNTWMRVNILSN